MMSHAIGIVRHSVRECGCCTDILCLSFLGQCALKMYIHSVCNRCVYTQHLPTIATPGQCSNNSTRTHSGIQAFRRNQRIPSGTMAAPVKPHGLAVLCIVLAHPIALVVAQQPPNGPPQYPWAYVESQGVDVNFKRSITTAQRGQVVACPMIVCSEPSDGLSTRLFCTGFTNGNVW